MKNRPDTITRIPLFTISRHRATARIALALLLCAAVAAAAASCQRFKKLTGVDSKKQGAVIKIISPHHEGIRKEMQAGFEKWHKDKHGADMAVEWVESGGASNDLKFILSSFEKKPDGIGLDLFYGGGSDRYIELAAKGLLQPCKPPREIVSQIPADLKGAPLYDAEGRWYGVSLGAFGILVNKQIVKAQNLPEVKTWADLADPRLQGWIELSDPRQSSSAHAIFEILLQRYGWRQGWILLGKIISNCRALPGSSGQVPQDVAAGQIAYGLTLVSYAYSSIEEHGADKLGFTMPEDATAVTPDPIAVLKGAPNAEAACEFVNFSLTEQGQKLWILKKGAPGGPSEFSINTMAILPSVYESLNSANTVVALNPYKMPQIIRYDSAKGAARLNLVDELAGAMYIEPLQALAAARKALGAAAPDDLFAPPLSEAQAMSLAAGGWNDPVQKDAAITQWKSAAAARYRKPR